MRDCPEALNLTALYVPISDAFTESRRHIRVRGMLLYTPRHLPSRFLQYAEAYRHRIAKPTVKRKRPFPDRMGAFRRKWSAAIFAESKNVPKAGKNSRTGREKRAFANEKNRCFNSYCIDELHLVLLICQFNLEGFDSISAAHQKAMIQCRFARRLTRQPRNMTTIAPDQFKNLLGEQYNEETVPVPH